MPCDKTDNKMFREALNNLSNKSQDKFNLKLILFNILNNFFTELYFFQISNKILE